MKKIKELHNKFYRWFTNADGRDEWQKDMDDTNKNMIKLMKEDYDIVIDRLIKGYEEKIKGYEEKIKLLENKQGKTE